MAYIGKNPKVNTLTQTPQSSEPSNPTEGMIYYDDGTTRSEGLYVYKNSAWTLVGSGNNIGDYNYIENGTANIDTSGWTVYANTTAATKPDDFGGTPSGDVSWSRGTVAPVLVGGFHFVLDKVNGNKQGEGVYYEFTAEEGHKTLKHLLRLLGAGTTSYVDGDTGLYLVGSNDNFSSDFLVISPNNPDINAYANPSQIFKQFQFHADKDKYRLCIHIQSTNTQDWGYNFDEIVLGPHELATGALVTDWQSFTPTGSWSTNTTYTGQYRQVGDTLQCRINIDLSGAPNAVNLTVNTPNGLVIDDTKLTSNSQFPSVGTVTISDGSNTFMGTVLKDPASDTLVKCFYWNDLSTEERLVAIDHNSPVTLANNDELYVDFEVPIVGWSSNTVSSADLSGREINVEYSGNGGESITANSTLIPFDTKSIDTTGSWDGDTFTAPEAGTYDVSGATRYGTAAARFTRVVVNGSHNGEFSGIFSNAATNPFCFKVNLNKGDTLSIQESVGGTLQDDASHVIKITKIASPQTILESEITVARASGNPASASAGNPVIFPTSDFDTHGAYSTSTGLYTAPKSGYVRISGYVVSSNSTITLNIAKDGSTDVAAGITDSNGEGNFTALVQVDKGQTLALEPSGTLDVSSGYISFEYIK